jgi:hypothetical protein
MLSTKAALVWIEVLGLGGVMTFFIGLAIVGYLSIIALLWCFRGFSRELKNGRKAVGLIVRVAPDQAGAGGSMRIQRVLQRELKVIELQPRRAHSLQSAKVVHLARVLGSRHQHTGSL